MFSLRMALIRLQLELDLATFFPEFGPVNAMLVCEGFIGLCGGNVEAINRL